MTGGDAAPLGSSIVLLGLTVAALWGTSDFLGGLASRKAPALLVVALAHGISVAALLPIAIASHARLPSEGTAVWGLITGISGGLALIVFYQALAEGEMGMAAALAGVLTALAPVVFSWVSEWRPKATQIAGFVIAAASISLIAYQPRGRTHARGLGLAALAGLGFGVFLIASKFASQGAILWPLAISRAASTTLASAIFLAARARQRSRAQKRELALSALQHLRSVLWLVAAAGLLEVAGNLLYMLDTLIGRLDVAAVVSSLYPAGTILLAVWLLKERATRLKTLGMILAIVAVGIISL